MPKEDLIKADCLFEAGNFNQAKEAYEAIISKDINNINAWLGFANSAFMVKEYKICIYASKSILEQDRNHFGINYLIGSAYLALGESAQARKAFKEEYLIDPLSLNSITAIGELESSLGNYVKANNWLEAAFRIDQNSKEVGIKLADNLEKLCKWDKAIEIYRQILFLKEDMAIINYKIGICFLRIDCQEEAYKSFLKAVNIDPTIPEAWGNIANYHLHCGRFKEAEEFTLKVIELLPNSDLAYTNLGLIQKKLGKYYQAELSTRQAVNLNPLLLDARVNLGALLKDQGKLIEAEKVTLKALEMDKNNENSYFNLSLIYKEMQKPSESINILQKSLELFPNSLKFKLQLAYAYFQFNELNKSFYLSREILLDNPDHQGIASLLLNILKDIDLNTLTLNETKDVVLCLLDRKDIDHRILSKYLAFIQDKFNLENIYESSELALHNPHFKNIINDDLVLKSLGLLTFNNLKWELALTRIRHDISKSFLSGTIQYSEELKRFLLAFSKNCFLSEYILTLHKDDYFMTDKLKEYIKNKPFNSFSIALLACYIPLKQILGNLTSIKIQLESDKDFHELSRIHFDDLIIEDCLASEIVKYGKMDNYITKAVKEQYEESPYPRWIYTNFYKEDNRLEFYKIINSDIFPNQINISGENNINVLIAGCGTGKQVIQASRYKNSSITAIDISKNSLAYAKRKANEYGMKNVRFINMDILDIHCLDKSFDIIECSGVLHHMADPEYGLKCLISKLKPHGYIQLALYSELARAQIVKAKEIIRDINLSPTRKDMREFRQRILSGEYLNFQSITLLSDFYSSSMFRDLLFNKQELRFTIPRLSSLLENQSLNFLGFKNLNAMHESYKISFPDDRLLLNLGNWEVFEKNNPSTFIEMYQFWVTRKDTSV